MVYPKTDYINEINILELQNRFPEEEQKYSWVKPEILFATVYENQEQLDVVRLTSEPNDFILVDDSTYEGFGIFKYYDSKFNLFDWYNPDLKNI
jgi:hypothetical protein